MFHQPNKIQKASPTKASDQYELGLRHLNGNGVPQSDTQAAFWIQESADQDHPRAIEVLVKMYWYGVGLPQSDKHAFLWTMKAHENGDPEATATLADFYFNGHVVSRNFQKATWLYQVAASKGHKPSVAMLKKHGPKNQKRTSRSPKAVMDSNIAIMRGGVGGLVIKQARSKTMTPKRFKAANEASMARMFTT